jgi:hypothetical protein
MTYLRLLLLSALWLPAPMSVATPDTPKPGDVLPALDALKASLAQSKTGLSLTLENAYYYAGWIPRGFITGVLRIRPGLLPGAPLTQQQWQDGAYYREGLYYLPGLTEWGARYRATRYDQRKLLEAANQDYSGTAEIGFGRFLGSTFDPGVLILVGLLFSWLRHRLRLRRLRRRELAEMADNYRGPDPYPPTAGPHAPLMPMPELDTEPEPGPEPRPDLVRPPTSTSAPAGTQKPEPNPGARQAHVVTEPGASPITPPPPPAEPKPPEPVMPTTDTTAEPAETPFAAFQRYRSEADQGSLDAQYRLAVMLGNGTGTDANAEQASHWFRKAAEGGHAQAQFELARHLLHGTGLLADEHAAALWLEQAAQQGLTEAKLNLATLYARGLGVTGNPDTALDWLRQAAADHDADAEELLGSVYRHGWLGLSPDPAKAGFWQQRALADQAMTQTVIGTA